jgi:hypothetical protein
MKTQITTQPGEKWQPHTCETCTQTTETAYPLDRGSAFLTLAVAAAQKRTGKKAVHLDNDCVTTDPHWTHTYPMAAAGYMTPRMRSNAARPRYHGLLAFGSESGTYLLTPKGAKFLKNQPVKKTAIVDKTTDHNKGYLEADGEITFAELIKSDEIPFWDGERAKVEALADHLEKAYTNPQLF